MNCQHCQGVMREQQFFDVERNPGLMCWGCVTCGWSCVTCGDAMNPLRDADRQLKELTMRPLPQGEPASQGQKVHLEADRITRVAA